MTRINVDTASPAVKKFIRSLEIDTEGLEVALGGRVVCKIIPAGQLSEAQKSAQLAEVRKVLSEARENSKRTPGEVIERKIQSALKAVRGRR